MSYLYDGASGVSPYYLPPRPTNRHLQTKSTSTIENATPSMYSNTILDSDNSSSFACEAATTEAASKKLQEFALKAPHHRCLEISQRVLRKNFEKLITLFF